MKVTTQLYIEGDKCNIFALGINEEYPTIEHVEKYKYKHASDVSEILKLLRRFAKNGSIHNTRKFKLICDGLFEFKSANNGHRVTCFYYKSRLICGYCFIKKSNKIPKRHKQNALRVKRIFESNYE